MGFVNLGVLQHRKGCCSLRDSSAFICSLGRSLCSPHRLLQLMFLRLRMVRRYSVRLSSDSNIDSLSEGIPGVAQGSDWLVRKYQINSGLNPNDPTKLHHPRYLSYQPRVAYDDRSMQPQVPPHSQHPTQPRAMIGLFTCTRQQLYESGRSNAQFSPYISIQTQCGLGGEVCRLRPEYV